MGRFVIRRTAVAAKPGQRSPDGSRRGRSRLTGLMSEEGTQASPDSD
jgi:hypothetical protein